MFNVTTYKSETVVTPVTRVIEKSITPDKVTDVYKDVKAEVEKTIIRTIAIDDNKLHGVIIEMVNDYAQMNYRYYSRFTLNGKEYTDIQVYSEMKSIDELIKSFQEFYADIVSRELVKETMKVIVKYSPSLLEQGKSL